MRKTVVFWLVGTLCALAVVVAVLSLGDSANNAIAEPRARETVRPQKPIKAGVAVSAERRQPKPDKPVLNFHLDEVDEDDDDKRTPAEKALAARIERSLDDEDLEAALSCAEEARTCAVTEIRQAMVDTLGWFGEKALPELTPFLMDADEDVRESAMNEWSVALSSIEDDGAKINVVELAMGVLRDEDILESISSEYIGVDEKLAVESLARIIAAGKSPAGVEKAKETYEFVTGDEWTGPEAAARWIAEEYEPPES